MSERNLFLIVAPSGAGKSSFVQRALREIPGVSDVITYTTRDPRHDEREGDHYHFVSKDRFAELRDKQDFFAEWAIVHGNLYGTPKKSIEDLWAQGRHPIMDIDFQGARSLKALYPQATSFFIEPPSIDELRHRILKRSGGHPPHDLDLRMERARKEMELAGEFDYRIINDNFERAFSEFKKIIEKLVG